MEKDNIDRIIERAKAFKRFNVGERRTFRPADPVDPEAVQFLVLDTINSGSPAISDTEWFRPTGEEINVVTKVDERKRQDFVAKYTGAILASSRKNVRTLDVHVKWGRIVLSDAALAIWLAMDPEGFFHAPVKLHFADGTWSAKPYNLVKIARVIDAVDWERSGYHLDADRVLPDGDVQVYLRRAGVVSFLDVIPDGAHMFNLPGAGSPELVSRALLEAMKKAKITGFRAHNFG
jgi:hypothetical protein